MSLRSLCVLKVTPEWTWLNKVYRKSVWSYECFIPSHIFQNLKRPRPFSPQTVGLCSTSQQANGLTSAATGTQDCQQFVPILSSPIGFTQWFRMYGFWIPGCLATRDNAVDLGIPDFNIFPHLPGYGINHPSGLGSPFLLWSTAMSAFATSAFAENAEVEPCVSVNQNPAVNPQTWTTKCHRLQRTTERMSYQWLLMSFVIDNSIGTPPSIWFWLHQLYRIFTDCLVGHHFMVPWPFHRRRWSKGLLSFQASFNSRVVSSENGWSLLQWLTWCMSLSSQGIPCPTRTAEVLRSKNLKDWFLFSAWKISEHWGNEKENTRKSARFTSSI